MSRWNKCIAGFMLLLILWGSSVMGSAVFADTSAAPGNDAVKVPILVYHNVAEFYNPGDKLLYVSPAELEDHFKTLKDAGYNSISFDDYISFVKENKPLPDKPIIITFDDGYVSNYEYAYPMLKKYGMKATIFIITGRVGAVEGVLIPHFTWDQAREMQQSGIIDIQSHTNTHPDMTTLDENAAQIEFRRSRYLIQKELGKTCDIIAYPYGAYNEKLMSMGEKAGYTIQCAVGDNGVNGKNADFRQLKRLTAVGGTTGQQVLDMITKNMDY